MRRPFPSQERGTALVPTSTARRPRERGNSMRARVGPAPAQPHRQEEVRRDTEVDDDLQDQESVEGSSKALALRPRAVTLLRRRGVRTACGARHPWNSTRSPLAASRPRTRTMFPVSKRRGATVARARPRDAGFRLLAGMVALMWVVEIIHASETWSTRGPARCCGQARAARSSSRASPRARGASGAGE